MTYRIELDQSNPNVRIFNDNGLTVLIPEGLSSYYSLFNIYSVDIKDGDEIPIEITGVSIEDLITNGANFTINERGTISGRAVGVTKGMANIAIGIKDDHLTEGTETLTLHVGGASASVQISDTSRALNNLTKIIINSNGINRYMEGSSFSLTIDTISIPDGADIPYTILGINKEDIVGGVLSGFIKNHVDASAYGRRAIDGRAVLDVQLLNNYISGDSRLVTVKVQDEWVQFILEDNSLFHPPIFQTTKSSPADNAVGVNPENRISLSFSTPIDPLKSDLTKVYLRDKSTDINVPISVYVGDYGNLIISPKTSLIYNTQYYVTFDSDVLKGSMGNPVAALTGKYAYDFQTMAEPTIYDLSVDNSSVNEGDSVLFTLRTSYLAAGASISYVLSNVDASDIWPTQLTGKVIVGADGRATLKVPIAKDFLTEGQELLVLRAGGESRGVEINDSSLTPIKPMPPTYVLYTVNNDGFEGGTLIFTLLTTNIPSGTKINYTISGVDAVDIWPAQLTGQVTVGANGQAVLSVPIAVDSITEGQENLVVTMADKISTVPIFDGLQPATYAISSSSSSVNEGDSVQFTVVTKNVKAGERILYSITGETGDITLDDFSPKQLSGDLSVDSNGLASVSVGTAADQLTEGTEVFIFTVANNATRVSINDISRDFVINPSVNSAIDEKFTAPAGQKSTRVPLNVSQGSLTKNAATDEWILTSNQLGNDSYTGFKRLIFNDKIMALDFEKGQSSYNAAMIIGAAFGKDSVNQYFGIGVSLFDNQQTMRNVCDLIVRSGLIESAVGSTNEAWVNKVYENVMGAKPDPFSSYVFSNYLDTGFYSKSSLLELAVGVSALEHQVGLIGLQTHGLAYQEFV